MGVMIALVIILLWFIHLGYLLVFAEISFSSPLFYIGILIQTYFYTGLFITAHDAMQKTDSRTKGVNKTIGNLLNFVYAGTYYIRSNPN